MALYALFRSHRYPVTLSAGLLRGAFGDVGCEVPVVVCYDGDEVANAPLMQGSLAMCGYCNVTIEQREGAARCQ